MKYRYLGDSWNRGPVEIAGPYAGQRCDPVLREDGRCVVGGGKALVRFEDGREAIVIRRRLRLLEKLEKATR